MQRSSGILLHVASLPGSMGVGDLGRSAYRFVDWLQKAGQSWWQILPFGQFSAEIEPYSPYSSQSSWAGAFQYIDMDSLVQIGDLKKIDLKDCVVEESHRVNYEKATEIKQVLLEKAAENFFQNKDSERYAAYVEFCQKEAYWLDDWVLFSAIKFVNNQKPWWAWGKEFALRDKKTLKKFSQENINLMDRLKYIQFVFCEQWDKLRAYALSKGIKIIGDMPIYCGKDSQDVWANLKLFCFDDNGKQLRQAGVPPDGFNENGQVWGMPLYRWEVHKAEKYKWWMSRLAGSFNKVDIVRLDHFIGFESYYSIPAKDKDARHGKWIQGPSDDFFKAVQKTFGEVPVIAEDLGDLTQAVIDLRERWNLPGLKVLHFGFDTGASNPNLPHNYVKNSVVYTGTHDNDVTLGWYKSLKKDERKYFWQYVGESKLSPVKAAMRLLYASVADLVVIPMQDVLELDSKARQNIPGSTVPHGNFRWKLITKDLSNVKAKELNECVKAFGR